MQLILDNILASIIAMSIFLILVTVNHRSQQTIVEAANYYAMKKQEFNFIEILASDFQNVREVKTKDGQQTCNGVPNSFGFVAAVKISSNSNNTEVSEVCYQRELVETRPDGTDIYQIQRYVDGVASGRSMAAITKWSIVALNEDNQPVQQTSVEDTEAIRIAFETVSPFLQDELRQAVPRTRWQTTFRPRMLRELVL